MQPQHLVQFIEPGSCFKIAFEPFCRQGAPWDGDRWFFSLVPALQPTLLIIPISTDHISDLSCSCDSVSASWGLSKQASLSSFFRPEEFTLKLWSTCLVKMHCAAGWCVHLSAGYWGGLLCSPLYVHGCFPAFPDPALTTRCNNMKDGLARCMLVPPLPRTNVFVLL